MTIFGKVFFISTWVFLIGWSVFLCLQGYTDWAPVALSVGFGVPTIVIVCLGCPGSLDS